MDSSRNSSLEGIIALKEVREHDKYFRALIWGSPVKCVLLTAEQA
jgi:hypothetical protein